MIQWKQIYDYLNFSELFGITYLCIHYLFIYIHDAPPGLTYFEFEVLTAVTMKNTLLWYATSHSLVDVLRCFRRTYCHTFSVMEHTASISLVWRYRQFVPLKWQWTSSGIHSFISQKTVLTGNHTEHLLYRSH
jgi:hypothetical protein